MTLDGRRLSGTSCNCLKSEVPATEISAPESGKAFTEAWPFRENIVTATVGAGSKPLLETEDAFTSGGESLSSSGDPA
jgi:hypothetical protein